MAFTGAELLFSEATGPKLHIGVFALDNVVGLDPDLSQNESHQFRTRVTKNPVEDGGTITDHIFNDPEIINISAFVSDDPVRLFSGIRDVVSNNISRSQFRDRITGAGTTRSIDAFGVLLDLRNNKSVITLQTGLKQYDDMVITNITVNRNARNGKSLTFDITLEHIEKVKVQTVSVPADILAAPVKDTAQSKVDTGNQTADSKTVLKAFTDGVKSLLFGG